MVVQQCSQEVHVAGVGFDLPCFWKSALETNSWNLIQLPVLVSRNWNLQTSLVFRSPIGSSIYLVWRNLWETLAKVSPGMLGPSTTPWTEFWPRHGRFSRVTKTQTTVTVVKSRSLLSEKNKNPIPNLKKQNANHTTKNAPKNLAGFQDTSQKLSKNS